MKSIRSGSIARNPKPNSSVSSALFSGKHFDACDLDRSPTRTPTAAGSWVDYSKSLEIVDRLENPSHHDQFYADVMFGRGVDDSPVVVWNSRKCSASQEDRPVGGIEEELIGNAVQLVKNRILHCFERLDPDKAVVALEDLWRQLDDTMVMVESRVHLLWKQTAPPCLADETPPWFSDCTQENGGHVAFDSARMLAGAIAARIDGEPPEVSIASREAIEFSWDSPFPASWLIYRPSIPWPGVRVIARHVNEEGKILRRIYLSAHSLLKEFAASRGGT